MIAYYPATLFDVGIFVSSGETLSHCNVFDYRQEFLINPTFYRNNLHLSV
jgi:hypothetical protein